MTIDSIDTAEEIIDELERAAVDYDLRADGCPEPRCSGYQRRAARLRQAAVFIKANTVKVRI